MRWCLTETPGSPVYLNLSSDLWGLQGGGPHPRCGRSCSTPGCLWWPSPAQGSASRTTLCSAWCSYSAPCPGRPEELKTEDLDTIIHHHHHQSEIMRQKQQVCVWQILTDGLNNHGVHFIRTELQFVARQTGTRGNKICQLTNRSNIFW